MQSLLPFLSQLISFLKVAFEIGILAFLIYYVLSFVRGTRGATILAGVTIVLIALGLMAKSFNLEIIDWMLNKLWTVLAITVLVIFQPEIRRAFAEIGRQQDRLRPHSPGKQDARLINTIIEATFFLADHRIGALVAIEQAIGMRAYAETGTPVNAPVSSKLLSTMFFPNTPLHDGGVIISGDTIIAAGCIFPLTQSTDLSRSLGTRHRAGVGLTEETDAVVIVVSEESGSVSLAHKGHLIRGVDRDRLRRHLLNYLVKKRFLRRRKGRTGLTARVESALAAVRSGEGEDA